MERVIFGELEVTELKPWQILTHSRSAWAVTLPKGNKTLAKLLDLQEKIGLFPNHYFKVDIFEPNQLLSEIYMLEAALVSYSKFDLVSLYALGVGLRYIKTPGFNHLEDELLRDWGEIYVEMLRFHKRSFLKKGNLLFPELVNGFCDE